MPKQSPWTKPQLILALNLYLKLPFGKLHSRTPEIIHLANLIGRTPGAVAMRLTNFASVDPYHQKRGVKGLEGGYKQVKPYGMNLRKTGRSLYSRAKNYWPVMKISRWKANTKNL